MLYKKRKTILLLSDFFNDTSGIANMSKLIILGTCHLFNWIQLACKPGSNHPQSPLKEGQIIDYSKLISLQLKVEDAYVYACISSNYGTISRVNLIIDLFLNTVLKKVHIDAIMHFTDPRFWLWLYAGERKIRQERPLLYFNVWDNLPYPQWNKGYYESCDWIANMSKQTLNIVKTVCKHKGPDTMYIPLGINSNHYKPLRNSDNVKLDVYRKLYGATKMNFIVLYNNRNITRKHTSDIMMGFKVFVDSLPQELQSRVSLIMKTDVVDNAGTDLNAVYDQMLGNKYNVKFINLKLQRLHLNVLYNLADVTVSLSSALGFGLTTAESLMAGTPIIATVTGGLQDQMRFVYLNDKPILFTLKFPTNVHGTYKKHGEWCFPIYTNCQSTAGSPMTPYIWLSYTDYNELAKQLYTVYKTTTKLSRKKIGLAGRLWMMSELSGMSMTLMSKRFIVGINKTIDLFKPRPRYLILKHESYDLLVKGLYNAILKEWS